MSLPHLVDFRDCFSPSEPGRVGTGEALKSEGLRMTQTSDWYTVYTAHQTRYNQGSGTALVLPMISPIR